MPTPHRPTILPLLAALAMLLSGCASGADPQATPPPTTADVITDPTDYSYVDNQTGGSGAHIHDYWDGRKNVTVVDDRAQTGSSCMPCGGSQPVLSFRPPARSIVPHGTGWVNISITWQEEPTSRYAQLELWVKSARDGTTQRVTTLSSGMNLRMETDHNMSDPPHYSVSLWRFDIVAVPSENIMNFDAELSIRVEAFRGLPLLLYPAHPDHWKNQTSIPLFAVSGNQGTTFHGPTGNSCSNACPGTYTPDDGVVVPLETAKVIVELEYGTPTSSRDLELRFHGADSLVLTPVAVRPDGTKYVFEITCTPTMADSPYAKESLWEFSLVHQPTAPAATWTGTISLTARAERDSD